MQQAGRAAIDGLPKVPWSAGPRAPKVVVALAPGQVLRKRLVLPAAVEQDLKQTLAYDLDRHTPFKPDELWFDAAVVGRDAQQGEIRVDWAAALRTTVAEREERAESFGATPSLRSRPMRLASEGPATTGGSRLNLLPGDGAPGSRVVAAVARLGAARAAVRSWRSIAVVLPIWQKRGICDRAASSTTEQARAQADAASALRNQLETATSDYNYVLPGSTAFRARSRCSTT